VTDPLVSIVIVTHNSQDDIVDCVNSVLLSQGYRFEVIIVDNASTDKTVEKIEENFANNEVVSLVNYHRTSPDNLFHHHCVPVYASGSSPASGWFTGFPPAFGMPLSP
jgi:cellulose synthase/poly-beta-1,6-N-acetylglucosamine synthase-like glycosyltransferase